MARLAAGSGIAASAFIRMAQTLGFTGYGELQRLFIATLQDATVPSYRERIRHYGGELALDDPANPAAVLRAFSQANQCFAARPASPVRRAPGRNRRLRHVERVRA